LKRCISVAFIVLLAAYCALEAWPQKSGNGWLETAEKTRQELWKAKKYNEAVSVLRGVYNNPDFLNLPGDERADVLYNLACGCSLIGHKSEALSFLEQAVASGFRNYYGLIADMDFNNIRKDKDFLAIEARLKRIGDYGQILKDHSAYAAQPNLDLPAFYYQASDAQDLQDLRRTYKLDEVAGQGEEISRIINLMQWVHKTIRHDGNSQNPTPLNARHIIEVCQKENRGVNCRMMATVLNEVYLAMGFKSRHITGMPRWEYDKDCHVINIVYSESLGKWLYMDPASEAYWTNEKGELLSIAEVRESIIAGRKLVLDKEANWNGQASDPKEYLQYMSKNLYRLSCPLASEYGYESKNGPRIHVYLQPADSPGKSNDKEIYITDAARFWALPVK
jgi:hypothetical protein